MGVSKIDKERLIFGGQFLVVGLSYWDSAVWWIEHTLICPS